MSERALPTIELMAAGVALLMVALRARFADLASAVSISQVGENLEIEVSKTKTSGANTDRLKLFLVGPRAMLTQHGWLESWMDLSEDLGIPFPAAPAWPSLQGNQWVAKQGRQRQPTLVGMVESAPFGCRGNLYLRTLFLIL